MDTIYCQVDDAEDPQEIQSLWIAGLEFVGGGGGGADDGLPKMVKPKDESTINLGTNEGSGVSKSVVVQAKNLNYGGSTTGLTIEAVSTGLSISYGQQTGQSSITIPQSNGVVNAEVTVAYSGSGGLEDGELRFKQGNSVLAVVVVEPPYFPEGFLADTAWERAGEQLDYPDSVQGYCTNPFTEAFHMALDSNNRYDIVVKGGFVKNNGELIRGKIMFKQKLEDTLTNSAYTKSSEPIRLKATNGSTLYNYVSATFKTSEIADCYIYDNVAHVYLWAGKNVDTSVAPEIPNV